MRILFGILLLFLGTNRAFAERTEQVFRDLQDRIVQVRVVERGSGTKSVLGSGFFVGDKNELVTNFHVIANILHYPDRFSIEIREGTLPPYPGTLSRIDVVHDLAVVAVAGNPHRGLDTVNRELSKGERLFSLGNPEDLGFTIVEGTYNGLVENSLYERIHFTGSINHGMSGGPAVTEDGLLAGVNVASEGNGIGFLVPARFVDDLLARENGSGDFKQELHDQLYHNQETYIEKLVTASKESVSLGDYQVPGPLAPQFKCWSTPSHRDNDLFNLTYYTCSTEDRIFVSDRLETGYVTYRHVYLSTETLNRFQFYSALQNTLSKFRPPTDADEDDVTNFKCEEEIVSPNNLVLKASLCARRYKKIDGLYDAVLVVASFNSNTQGLLSIALVGGASFPAVQKFTKLYLEGFKWTGN